MSAMIQTQGLAVGYEKHALVRDIHFTLQPGEICCLLGPNGCGKSTLIKTLLGLIPAIEGEVTLGGKSIKARRANELAQLVAYVPQAHTKPFPFLAQDMVLMGASAHLNWYEPPKKRDTAKAQAALEALGIGHLAFRPYPQLSGGEKQLVLIARALCQASPLLVMDEPTASLDFGNQIRVIDHILALKDQGKSVLITTHTPSHVRLLADTLAIIDREGNFSMGPVDTLFTPERLAPLFSLSLERLKTLLTGTF